jgi:steroid 5-alpha reductase family enzyme
MPPIPEIATILGINLAICVASFVILWGVGCAIRDVTFVDTWWALGLAFMSVTTFFQAEGSPERMRLILVLACAWGLRLGLYILWRWRSHGPDRRYVKMLARAQEARGWSYPKAAWRMVFMLQAPILWATSLPVQLGQMSATPAEVGTLGWACAGLVVFGILFESLADFQLVRFKANPANAGKVFDSGLWRYTRHPNYFGDLCVWFGLFGIAAETTLGLFSVVGPLLLLVMFLKYSGGPSYEKRLTYQRPGYADYIARTSSLIPWPPKRAGTVETKSAA